MTVGADQMDAQGARDLEVCNRLHEPVIFWLP